MSMDLSRRAFIATSITAASATRVIGANDRVRIGIIGAGDRGSYLMREANRAGNIEWVAVCDAWDQRRDRAEQTAGSKVEKIADYRKLLDRKDIDAVIVATWDNNHSKVSQYACKAGKDVYVEKPMTSLPAQGAPLVRAAREHKRVLQVGVQQRSTPHFLEAKERFIDSGLLGPVHMVRTLWNNNGGYLYKPPAGMEQKPAGLDWDACLGDLPKIPWDPKRYFNRFSYIELCCGQTGGLLVHMIDVVQWYLGITKPTSAVALGGIYQYNDGRTSPDNINMILEYPEKKMTVTFEATVTDHVRKENDDIVFMGEGGRLHIFRYGYRFLKPDGEEITAKGTPDRHMDNFLDCVRSRKEPNATVEQGHYGAMACHMGNIAWLEKRRVNWQSEWNI